MKKTLTFVLLALFSICGFAQTIDPVLLEEMRQRTDDEKIQVVVIMKSQYDRQQLGRRAANYVTRAERRDFVVNELKRFTEASQHDLRTALTEMERHNMTTTPTTLWMANAVCLSATKQAINDLAMRRDVQLIGLDEKRNALFNDETTPTRASQGISTHVTRVNANQVWDLGYTGQGVVVALLDSGVNYNHLDLADHLWDGGTEYPHHGYDFINNDNDPMDDHGQGTHCAGVICGDGTAGTQTGIAPDATLMCLKVLDEYGNAYVSMTCNAMQWAVEQGCDVINIGFGWFNSSIMERTLLRNTCAAVLDAGVIGAIGAGDGGYNLSYYPIPDNVTVPGSCPPPYMDAVQANNSGGLSCALSVGTVDNYDNHEYSSNGPVTWSNTGYADYPYTEGSSTDFGLIRPDLCAPGYEVTSAANYNNSGYISMTSNAAATSCVAGCISLLLSKNVNATPAQICQVLEENAVSLATGKSNTFGFGRVNALAAINAMPAGPLSLEAVVVNDGSGNNNGKLNPGETAAFNLTLKNDSNVALNGVTLVLTSESDDVTITNGTTTLGNINPGQIRIFENTFGFTLSNNAPGGQPIQFAAEAFLGEELLGILRFNIMVYGHALVFNQVTIMNDNNNNGSLEAGETATMNIVISNAGNEPAPYIIGTLSSTFPQFIVNTNNQSFGTIPVGGQASANFNVALANSAPGSYSIDLSLDLVDGYNRHTQVDFEIWRKAITLTSNPAGAGTLTGGGNYGAGEQCTINATPNSNYAFVKWTLDGETVSYFPSYTFTVTDAAEYVAEFQQISGIAIGTPTADNSYLPSYTNNYYSLTQQIYTAAEMGGQARQISSVSFYNTRYNTTRKLAIYLANTNKSSFASSTDWISVTDANLVYNGNVTLTSYGWVTIYFATPFSYDGFSNLALIVDDNTGSYGSMIKMRTFATTSNQALYVTSSNTNYSTTNPNYNGTLLTQKDQVIFGIANLEYTVSATASPTAGGTVSGNTGLCFYGQPITLTATPNTGYVFNNWTKNGEVVSYYPTYSFSVSESAQYVANFQLMDGIVIGEPTSTSYNLPTYTDYPNSYTQQIYTVSELGTQSRVISNVSFYNTGNAKTRNLTVYMVPTSKSNFSSNTDWVTVTEAHQVFEGNVTFPAKGWGTIYFNELFNYNGSTNVALVVVDHSSGWNNGMNCRTFNTTSYQAIYSSRANPVYDPITYTGGGSRMISKNQVVFGFPNGSYTVTATANPTSGGSVSGGGGTYYLGQYCTLTATPNSGYVFNNWTVNGAVVSSEATYTFPVTGNMNLVANFGTPIMITVTVNPDEAGTVSGAGGYASGQTCTLTATPNEGYVFTNWTRNGSVVSCLSTYSFTVSTETQYVANFKQVSGRVVGEPIANNSYLPTYSYYPYSLTQQIYTASELGGPRQISSISFFNSGYGIERDLTVYLVSTTKTAFNSENDWFSVTDSNKVFSGMVTMSGRNWVTVYFNTPYYYTGSTNLALIVYDKTNHWDSGITGRTFNAEGTQAIYAFSEYPFDLSGPTNTGTLLSVKNQIILDSPVYEYLMNLSAVPEEGGTVSGGEGWHYYGQPVTVTATPNEGYVFNYWTKYITSNYGGYDQTVSYLSPADLPVTDNIDYVAHFQEMDGVIIGDATHINHYLPTHAEYPYSLTQQIYTADELGIGESDISSVSFFNVDYSGERDLTIYMVNTDKTQFDNFNDWIAINDEDIVFSGVVYTEETGWTTIYFNTPFNYNGSSNVAMIVYDKTPEWSGGLTCRTFDTETPQAIYAYDDYPINTHNPIVVSTLLTEKNQVVFGVAVYEFTATVSADPEEGGTVNGGGGLYFYGQPIPITATANPGYVFNNWTKYNEEYGGEETVSYFSSDYMAVTESTNYVAHFQQMDGIVIGDAVKTHPNLPTHDWPNSLTQQIYTVEEMGGETCEISSVSFFNTSYGTTRNLDVYLVNTSKSVFDNTNDFIPITESVPVLFSGNVTYTSYGWATIYFATPFIYDGISNLALIINDKTSQWNDYQSFRTFDAEGTQSICVYTYGSAIDPSNLPEYDRELMTEKNQVVFGIANYQYQVNVSANPPAGGTVSGGGGLYYYGQPIPLSATANDNYAFSTWTKGDDVVSCFPNFNLSVTESADYVANFKNYDGIFIGEQANTLSYVPTYYYNTFTQEIYTAAEMGGQSCQISSVSFFNGGTINRARNNISIFMVNTEKSVFENNNDWVTVTENDLLYSGRVEFPATSWTTIYFNTPFEYDGTSNVALLVCDNSNTYITDIECRTFNAGSNQVLRTIRSHNSSTDPYNITISGALETMKNQVIFGYANFNCQITASANPTEGGSVSGDIGLHYYGQPITLTATPSAGYVFNNWTKNGEVVSYLSTYSFSVTETAHYVANFQQANGIAIGEAASTYNYLPIYSNNPYSMSQQIYTAAEMGGVAHDISSVSFFNTGTAKTRNLTIFMRYTDKSTFGSTNDWITVTENDKVFSGSVTLAANDWATVNFNKLFNYNNVSSNVVLVVVDNSGSYNSGLSCRTFGTTENQALRLTGYSAYDPYNSSSYTGALQTQKNQVIFGFPDYSYSVTALANPEEGGTVSGGGQGYFLGQSCTLTATANTGYVFNNWTLNGTVVSSEETYTFAVTGNMNLVANFGTPIMVTATANPTEGGTVSGGGGFGLNHSCTLTATANPGYVFVKWTKGTSTSALSYISTYTFTVNANNGGDYVANFEKVENGVAIGDAASTTSYLPTYCYNPYSLSQQIYTVAEMGGQSGQISSVSFFNTSFNRTRNLTVYMVHTNKTAFNSNTDWIPVSEADIVFSGSVTLAGNNWATIYFSTPFSYNGTSNVALVIDDNTGGYGSNISMRTFSTTENQAIRITSSSVNYDPCNPISSQGTLMGVKNQVYFHYLLRIYAVNTTASPTDGGTVSGGGGLYYLGEPCTVTATPNPGYIFYYWKQGNTTVSFDPTYTFQVMGNTDLVAHFGPPIQITVTASPEEGGTVTGAGEYAATASCTITATPNPGYVFIKWMRTGNSTPLTYFSTYTFNTPSYDAEYVAVFELVYPDVVIGDAEVSSDYLPTYTNDKYSLTEQIYTSDEIGTSGDIYKLAFFNIGYERTRNLTIYMKHTDKTAFANNYDWVSVSEADQVFSGSVTMTRNAWNEITLDAPFHYNGTSNVVLVVDDNTGSYSSNRVSCRVFNTESTQSIYVCSDYTDYDPSIPTDYYGNRMSIKNQIKLSSSYIVTATADPTEGGTVTGGGACLNGSTCTVTATPAQGYHFFYWTENEETVSFDASYSFTVESNRNLVAHFGQVTNHWTSNNSGYSSTMSLTGIIQIDGVEQRSDLLEVGAFCGTECRGTVLANLFELPGYISHYIASLTIHGEVGDELTFKLYDHRIGQELDLTSPNLTFVSNGVYGDPIVPYVLNFITTVEISTSVDPEGAGSVTGAGEYPLGTICTLTATANNGYQFHNWTMDGVVVSTDATYVFTATEDGAYVAHFLCVQTHALASGWNWFSTYLDITLDDLKAALVEVLPGTDITIISQEGNSTSYNGSRWRGRLTTLDLTQMYMIQTSAACTIELQGLPVNPTDYPITIYNGWNWIGYPNSQSMTVNDALSNFTPEANDIIKSRDSFSTFISYGPYQFWYSTALNTLEPGQGYMYQSNSSEQKTLIYQTNRTETLLPNITPENNFYVPSNENYANNMTITAVVDMDGQELREEGYELAAFVGNECRGSVKLMYVEPFNRYVAFLTVYGESSEEMRFVLTDGRGLVESDDSMDYVKNGIVGTLTEPAVLHFGTLGVDDFEQVVVNVFPNPSNGIFNVEGNGIRKIEVMDALGQIILSKEVEDDSLQINLSNNASGVYLLRVITDNGISTNQIIKK